MSDNQQQIKDKIPGWVALEDGRVFKGVSFAAPGKRGGEVVFNTSMSGYQEVLTDPSYKGQIVTMTYPLIGNYGVNPEDVESSGPQVEGFVVREYCAYPSNWRSRSSLGHYLTEHDIVGVSGIDTRALTRHIRLDGAMRAVIAAGEYNPDDLVDEARTLPSMTGADYVQHVTCEAAYDWTDADPSFDVMVSDRESRSPLPEGTGLRVAAMDFGVKFNILKLLASEGHPVRVFPAHADADEILAWNPDGIFLSNGPGDPAAVTYAVQTIRALLGKKPLFGICLGNQLLGLALGGTTHKLKFGHRGGNQPVQDLKTGTVQITSQNHGFCVDMDSLKDKGVELTHINLNDKTVEGLRHEESGAFSVQYHPEASPGPHDASYLFREFTELMMRKAQ